jgi:hypothetical protein
VAAPADQADVFVAVTVTGLAATRRRGLSIVGPQRRPLTDHLPANAQNLQFWRDQTAVSQNARAEQNGSSAGVLLPHAASR